MTEPRKWTQQEIDAEMGVDIECWQCGGEGYVSNCQDEICCLYPEDGCELCTRRCDVCNSGRKK
jgi:hypothetical protein